jgi:hypothetical protein
MDSPIKNRVNLVIGITLTISSIIGDIALRCPRNFR